MSGVIDIAAGIATKSPVAVQGTKINLVYSRDHTVEAGLDYIVSNVSSCMCLFRYKINL